MFDLLVVFGVAFLFIQIIRILLSGCDLHLQWYCKFGETPASLKGKVVWITGASSGIGEELAYKLSSVGCKLILSARREDRLKQVKDLCLKQYSGIGTEDIFILPLDLLDFGSHANAVEVVFKKIDVLVNNAGRSQRALWEKTSLEVDKAMLNVNVLGLLSLTKCILPEMIKQNYGRIVITCRAPGLGSYSGSKHALHGWFEALRIEGYNYNIDVTMVCPGPVFSEALLHAFTESGEKTLGVEMKPTEKRMTAERCAYLMSIAMENDLDEVWLSGNPELLFLYLYQYFPTITRRLGRRIGAKRVKKLQSGMTNLH
ncbi:dehydrogenase/reductase SDR family member 7-like [Mytilus trossulus]|uniref:dehydrogenase/reductase SDR family member 7-like n=1 Tax=Mytilus trossulus TaxID=6551 RepID=UPI003005C85B